MSKKLKEEKSYNLEEYIELDKRTEERLEYFEGRIWRVPEPGPAHKLISENTFHAIKNALHWQSTRLFDSHAKIKVPASPPYRYAEISGLYGEPVYESLPGIEMLVNPSLIVEILTPQTELFKRADKFSRYKSIPNLTDYLLIAEDRPHATLLTREDEEVWLHREYNSPDKTLCLFSLDCEISLSDIYRNLDFQKAML